jgi:hypothetical protein
MRRWSRLPRPVYDSLINAATSFLTVAVKFGTVLSEEFEAGIKDQADALQSVLVQCPPTKQAFDGVFNEALVTEDVFRHDTQPDHTGPAVGIRLTYPPTGHRVESYSKPSREANRATAMKGLRRHGRAPCQAVAALRQLVAATLLVRSRFSPPRSAPTRQGAGLRPRPPLHLVATSRSL